MGLFDLFKKKERASSSEFLERRRKCAELSRQFVPDDQYREYYECLTEDQREFLSQELRSNYHPDDQIWGERLIMRVLYTYNAREGMLMEWDKRMEKYQQERRLQTIEKSLGDYDPADFAWLDDEKKALDELGDDTLALTNELKKLYTEWPEEFDRIGTIPYINDKK